MGSDLAIAKPKAINWGYLMVMEKVTSKLKEKVMDYC